MAQTFPLVSIDPSTKTGTQLATDLENFSETMRSMMSGPARASDFVEGLWLRTNPDGTAELVYSNALQNVDLPIFTVAQNGTGIELTASVGLASAPAATTDETGVVRLATEAEALVGTSATRVPLVRETQAMIAQAIDALVAGSASALDTLNELASALGNDPNFATTTANALAKRVAVDAPQSFSASEQAQARDNLGLGSLAVQETIAEADIDAGAVTSAKIGAAQVDKAKLNADVFAATAQTLSPTPPADQALSPQTFFAADEVAVVDVPANAPTTLASNGYRRRFYVQSTGGMYRWVPAPVEAFVLQGTAPAVLGDLADVDIPNPANGSILIRSGATWVAASELDLQRQIFSIGDLKAGDGTSLKPGWILPVGQELSRTLYSEYFSLVGIEFGSGDGSSTFNAPDLRGRTVISAAPSRPNRSFGGEESHTLTVAEMPSHDHPQRISNKSQNNPRSDNVPQKASAQVDVPGDSTITVTNLHYFNGISTESSGSDQPHNNMQPYYACNFALFVGA